MRGILRDVAWLCRYARGVTMTELLACDRDFLRMFGEELSKIVERENGTGK